MRTARTTMVFAGALALPYLVVGLLAGGPGTSPEEELPGSGRARPRARGRDSRWVHGHRGVLLFQGHSGQTHAGDLAGYPIGQVGYMVRHSS